MSSNSVNNNSGGLLRRSTPRNDDVNTRNYTNVTASPKGAAVHSQLKLNQTPESEPSTKAKQENNIGKQLSSPGAEPPKDPDNSRAEAKAKLTAKKKAVLEEYEKSRDKFGNRNAKDYLGSKEKPITNEQLQILLNAGKKYFYCCHFERGVRFNKRELNGFDLRKTTAPYADFSQAKLSNCFFTESQLKGANFNGSNLDSCKLDSANLYNSSFKGTELDNCKCNWVVFINSDLTDATISKSAFYGSEMQLSNWQKAKILNKDGYQSYVDFNHAHFDGEDFTKASQEFLKNSSFYHASLSHANFAGIELPSANFFRNFKDESCLLREQDFTNANLKGTVFGKNANFPNSKISLDTINFSAANLEGADLRNIDEISNCKFIGANLRNLKVQEETLIEECDFRLADLRDNDLGQWDNAMDNKVYNCKVSTEQLDYILDYSNQPPEHKYNQPFEFDNELNIPLNGLNLEGANLAGMVINGPVICTNFRNANFGSKKEGTQTQFLAGPDRDGYDLRFADFRASNIGNARFTRGYPAQVFGMLVDDKADCSNIRIEDRRINTLFNDHDTTLSHISHKDLSKHNLKGMRIQRDHNLFIIGTDFSNASLRESKFKGVSFVKPILDNTNLKGAVFNNTDLAGTKFKGSNLEQVEFLNTDLQGCRFDGSSLKDTKFTNTNLNEANLLDAISLEGADLGYEEIKFAVGGHRGEEANKARTRRLFIERGCDLDQKSDTTPNTEEVNDGQ